MMQYMYNIKVISVRKNLIQGYSSVGRAAVSKTACRGFKSFCPCQKEKESFYGSFFFFVCANGSENKARGACRGVRVSGGDLCTKCRSTDRAGRRDQVLLPLPKKVPNFRCFFLLFTPFYGDFACFFHIDKTTAHGLFRTPLFHFHTVFCSLCATQSTQSVWYIIKKASITIQIRL